MADVREPLTRADVLRAVDVADLLGLPLSTVHDWARQGRLPSRKRGRHRLFLRSEVEAWLLADDGP
jgi:excisionase family DNA binding protein